MFVCPAGFCVCVKGDAEDMSFNFVNPREPLKDEYV